MFVTKKILEDCKINNAYLDLFNNLYPDGEEFSNMLGNEEIPNGFFHWVFLYLPLTDEEKEMYMARVQVKNSQNVYNSRNIENCNHIFSSRNCTNSSYVRESAMVNDSTLVVGGNRVTRSEQVYDSKKVEKSKLIVNSSIITNSKNVWLSEKVHNSNNVFRSDTIYDSDYIANSKILEDCYFCSNCSYANNLMFTYNARGDSYMIFNKEVSKEEFTEAKNYFKQKYDFLLNYGRAPSTFRETVIPVITHEDFSKHYLNLTNEFYEDVKNLPNYDPFILYCITFNSTLIERTEENGEEESNS